jgi:drug/metabolite transporter (DMT)-like permease
MPTAAAERKTALAIFAILSVIWGYNWIVMKIGLGYAGPFAFSAIRSVVAAVFLFLVLIVTGRSLRPPVFWGTLLLGLLQTASFTGLVQLALVQGGAGKTAVLAYTMPFWTLLLAWLALGERLRPLQWLAVALAGGGLLLILQPWDMRTSALSKLLALAAGFCWAASVIVAKRLRARHQVDLLALTTWQLALGMIPLLIVAWLVPERPVEWSMSFVWIVLYAGILGTAFGWMMWLYVLNRLPAGTASLNSLAIPVISVFAAWLQFGERPAAIEAVGMAIIACGLALMSAVALREQQRAEPSMAQE